MAIKTDFEKNVIQGEIMFSNLKTPVAYVDGKFVPSSEEGNYDISIKIAAKDAEKVMKKLDTIDERNFQQMVSTLTPAAKRSAKMPDAKYKEILDADGEPTGDIRVSVRRKAKVGAPKVYDTEGAEMDVNYLPKGTVVDVHVSTKAYAIGNKVGTAYYLNFVKVVKEVASANVELEGLTAEQLLSSDDVSPRSTAEMPF